KRQQISRSAGLLRSRSIEAGHVAIGLRIARSPKPLAVLSHFWLAARLPGSLRFRISLVLRRSERTGGGVNDVIAIDAEVGGFAWLERNPFLDLPLLFPLSLSLFSCCAGLVAGCCADLVGCKCLLERDLPVLDLPVGEAGPITR